MRRGNLIVLLAAVVMGGIAAFMARSWLERQNVTQPEQPNNGTIVVAASPLGYGTILSKDNVMEIPWHGPKISAAFATKEEMLKEGRRVVLTPLERNEPIFRPKVTGPGSRASLSSLLEDGMRAVTLRVDDVRGVAGFVLPADRVDVVLIRSETRSNGNTENFSDVLMQHVKVLAVDQLANERQEQPIVAKAVTLEVTTEQAQKILLATNIGKLSLILRQAGEANPSLARRISDRDLGLAEIPKEVPVPVAAAAPAPMPVSDRASIEIVRGTRGERYDVKRVDGEQSFDHLVGSAK
jgi:pilus assembly protein CpaB